MLSIFRFFLEGEETPFDPTTLIILGLLVIMAVFMFILPNRRNRKKAQTMMETLKVGSKVTTIGGIIGIVTEIDETANSLVIETGSKDHPSQMQFTRNAIYYVFPSEDKPVEPEYNEIKAPGSKK